MEDNKKISFKKIVYFDEQAAMDLLLEENDGILEKTAKKANKIAASVEGGVKVDSPKLLERLFSFNLSGNARGAASSIAQTQIKSTILTEFLTFAKKNSDLLFDEICSLEITDDSLAYIRSAGKYLKIFNLKGSSQINSDLESVLNAVNIDNLDRILDQASGYYKLTDLPKMNLRIMGVKVGETTSLDISIDSELNSFNNTDDNSNYNDINVIDDQISLANLSHYDIIDALIAGVE